MSTRNDNDRILVVAVIAIILFGLTMIGIVECDSPRTSVDEINQHEETKAEIQLEYEGIMSLYPPMWKQPE